MSFAEKIIATKVLPSDEIEISVQVQFIIDLESTAPHCTLSVALFLLAFPTLPVPSLTPLASFHPCRLKIAHHLDPENTDVHMNSHVDDHAPQNYVLIVINEPFDKQIVRICAEYDHSKETCVHVKVLTHVCELFSAFTAVVFHFLGGI